MKRLEICLTIVLTGCVTVAQAQNADGAGP